MITKTLKKIDMHAHVTVFPEWVPEKEDGSKWLSAEQLTGLYDRLNIERGVLLPIVSPEGMTATLSNENCLFAVKQQPERFSWFCNVDPRAWDNAAAPVNYYKLLEHYKQLGAKGLGELTANLYVDDLRMDRLFSHCEEMGMPVLFHISTGIGQWYGIADELGLPRLEKMLKKHPKLQFIGHSQPFWSEMSADNTDELRNDYPKGKVTPGRLWQLMETYENLTCELSARSGMNALSRDTENAIRFLNTFQDRIYYGCDICAQDSTISFEFRDFLDGLVQDGLLSEAVYRKVCRDNAAELLGL